jgi:5-methylcytosine-specific restriction endonuclease McrA
MDSTKRCAKCKEYKDREAFSKNASRNDGLHSECRVCNAAYRAEHREEIAQRKAQYMAQYRQDHRDKIVQRNAQYRQDHREEKAQYDAQWRKDNPDKAHAKNHRYRARKAGNGGTYTALDVKRQGETQNWKCWWRGPGCAIDCRDKYEVDHLVPLNRGGHNNPSNLVVSCQHCNRSKQDKLPSEFCRRLL